MLQKRYWYSLLCSASVFAGTSLANTSFEELRELCLKSRQDEQSRPLMTVEYQCKDGKFQTITSEEGSFQLGTKTVLKTRTTTKSTYSSAESKFAQQGDPYVGQCQRMSIWEVSMPHGKVLKATQHLSGGKDAEAVCAEINRENAMQLCREKFEEYCLDNTADSQEQSDPYQQTSDPYQQQEQKTDPYQQEQYQQQGQHQQRQQRQMCTRTMVDHVSTCRDSH